MLTLAIFTIMAIAFAKMLYDCINSRIFGASQSKELTIETIGTSSTFWNSYCSIHDIRKICIKYVGISIDSSILTSSEEIDLYALLLKQYGINNRYYKLHMIQTKLLYSASNESFDKNEFDTLCTGYQNVLILLRNGNGNVIGGFTSVGFPKLSFFQIVNSNKDPSAFLIRIRSKDGLMPTIFELKDHRYTNPTVSVSKVGAFSFGVNEFELLIKDSVKMDIGRSSSFYGIDAYEFSGGVFCELPQTVQFSVEQIEAHQIIL